MATEEHNIEYPEELQFLLEDLLGSRNVYFQPPSGTKLTYPCILYQLDYVKASYADNNPYINGKRYLITYISRSPDQYMPDKIAKLPSARFNRFYVSDNLNHTSYQIYFDAKANN